MIDFTVIGSGSSGNAVVIERQILIDCGLPAKRILPYAPVLKLVLLTHIHGDHFHPATVRALHRERPTLRWGCCEWMVPPLLDAGVDRRQIDVYELNGMDYLYSWNMWSMGDVGIMPVELSHNVRNCGYHIRFPDGRKVFYATDTGYIDNVKAPGYDLYLIEANHTEAEIAARIAEKHASGAYAYEEQAAVNHLSREQAEAWLARNAGPESRYVFLHGHQEAVNLCPGDERRRMQEW